MSLWFRGSLIKKTWLLEQSFLILDHYTKCFQELWQSQGHHMDSLGVNLLSLHPKQPHLPTCKQ